MAADDLSQSGAEGGDMGNMSPHFGMLKAGFKVDTKAVKDLRSEFQNLHTTLKDIKTTLQDISKLSSSISGPSSAGVAQGGAVSGNAKIEQMNQQAAPSGSGAGNAVAASARSAMASKMGNVITNVRGAAAASSAAGAAPAAGAATGGFAAGAAAGPAGVAAVAIAQAVTKMIGGMMSAMNTRIDEGYAYTLSADKMNMRLQQMTGMSALDVQQQFRQPLTQYRLGGPEGINTALSLTRATGLSNQASSIDAIRTISGFAYSAEDASRMIQTLASPQVANRMFMMSGGQLGIYGIGGQERSSLDVLRGLVARTNLTTRANVQGARQQGSMQRMALSSYGLPTDMQDVLLDYAEQNITFQERGGSGSYDPANREHQQLMGISDSFALQQEETQRVKVQRDEQFYRRQVDNYADLEKATQNLTKTFGLMEDTLSSFIGQGASNRPYIRAVKGFLNFFPGGGMLADMLGDPMPNGDEKNGSAGATMPTYSGRKPISSLDSMSSFSKLHPKMRERVKNLIVASGGRVGFGGGVRDTSSQRQMFLDRYYVVDGANAEYDVEWEGKRWKKRPGVAAAAPPGRSMHEIGLAVDLTGDMDWIVKNAGRFGLRSFHDVNSEPWHVQPQELPGSRREYEKSGAPWGTNGQYSDSGGAPPTPGMASSEDEHAGGGGSGTRGMSLRSYLGMSINEIIETGRAEDLMSFLAGGGGNSSFNSGQSSVPKGGNTATKALRGVLSGKEIVGLMSRVGGWSGDELIKAVAISHRESRWDPNAYNPNAATRDLSFGLFQINMKDDDPGAPGMGASRRKWFGIGRNEDLFNPDINVRSARKMYDSSTGRGRSGFHDWGSYKGKSDVYGTDMAMAAQTVREAMSGDPVGATQRGSGSRTSVFNEGASITIAPVINMASKGNATGDAQAIANEVIRIIQQNSHLLAVRSS